MSSIRIASKGASIKYGTTATPTTVLAGIKSVALTVGSRAMINVTGHDDTNTKNYIPEPLRDTNGLDVTLFWDPNNVGHEALRLAHDTALLQYLTLLLPNATPSTYPMSGYILDWTAPAMNPESGALECTFKFKATSHETFAQ